MEEATAILAEVHADLGRAHDGLVTVYRAHTDFEQMGLLDLRIEITKAMTSVTTLIRLADDRAQRYGLFVLGDGKIEG